MNRYENLTSRVVCGIVAIAMAALTIGIMVVIPTKMDSANPKVVSLGSAKTPATNAVASNPARIDGFPAREPNVVVQTHNASKRKQQC